MTNIEKRILLNQREIMFALKYVIMNRPIDAGILTGLGQCCEATKQVLESEIKDDQQR